MDYHHGVETLLHHIKTMEVVFRYHWEIATLVADLQYQMNEEPLGDCGNCSTEVSTCFDGSENLALTIGTVGMNGKKFPIFIADPY